jgi:hypothetical protein
MRKLVRDEQLLVSRQISMAVKRTIAVGIDRVSPLKRATWWNNESLAVAVAVLSLS